MKPPIVRLLNVFALGALAASALGAQEPRIDFPRPSPTSTLKQRVGATDIEVRYSRPGVKGRKIFGGADSLVPFGSVWRTGANEATFISFSTPVNFGGAEVPAGGYAVFSIPGENEWTVILNKTTKQWGAYTYDSKNDLVRVKAVPVRVEPATETFTIDINDIRDGSATLNLEWANTRVPIKLRFDIVSVVVPQIEAAMASGKKLSPWVYDSAAQFYLDNRLDLQKAEGWEKAAIAQAPNSEFYLYYHQAKILAELGDKAGAASAARRSIELVSNQKGPEKDEYIRLNRDLLASIGQ